MRNAVLVDKHYDTVQVVATPPLCGDYCDACGDCLHCYGEDACGHRGDEGHTWIVYAEQHEDFLRDHPIEPEEPSDA